MTRKREEMIEGSRKKRREKRVERKGGRGGGRENEGGKKAGVAVAVVGRQGKAKRAEKDGGTGSGAVKWTEGGRGVSCGGIEAEV